MLFKVIEYILLAFGIISIYGQGVFLTKEIQLLRDTRTDLDMQLEVISRLTGERRRADIEIEE